MNYPKPTISVHREVADVQDLVTQSRYVDARNSRFNDVHGHGYQVNNEVHGPQTNHTTINQYHQDSAKERQEFADWLSPLNFRQTQSEIYGGRQEGTGEWVLDVGIFKEWQRGDVKTLWCPGIPGAGKTVLASYIIDLLVKQHKGDNIAVVYIYCDHKDQARQTIYNLVASLLKQLVQESISAFERVKSEYQSHQNHNSRPTLSQVRNTLMREIGELSQVFIIVDALDEVPEDDDTRAELIYSLQSLGGSLLATSRDITPIGSALRDSQCMVIRAQDDDIRRYIEGRIRPGRCLTRLDKLLAEDFTLRKTVVESITAVAEGMFLLSRLHMDFLARKTTRGEIRHALKNLPKGVDIAYDETMKRIYGLDETNRELALRAIMLITYAFRHLSIEELQEALALSFHLININSDDLVDESIITDICAGLVVIDESWHGRVFRLVHYTAQEYFDKYSPWPFPDPHAKITDICLGALSVLSPGITHLGSHPTDTKFSDYAGQYWGHHARGLVEETNKTTIREFIRSDSRVNNALKRTQGFYSDYSGGGSALHLCVFFSLHQTIDHLLESEGIVDQRDTMGRTPLYVAAKEGHVTVARLLVNRGCDMNIRDQGGVTPLAIAAMNRRMEVVQLLLERHNVDVNMKNGYGDTPLLYAAANGDVDIVKMLLERYDIDLNSRDKDGWTPLSRAAFWNKTEVVKLLLERQYVDVNSRDHDSRTPLALAGEGGDVVVVEAPLTMGDIDVNQINDYGETPLSLAAQRGNVEVTRLLLAKNGIDINSKDKCGRTPLLHAAQRGNVEVVRMLLTRHGLDINSKDEDGWIPLSYAVREENVEVVRVLLMRHDVDVNFKDGNYALLSFAVQRANVEILQELLTRKDLDVNSKDRDGRTPISHAADGGIPEIMRLLLTRNDVDVNSKDEIGRTPLSLATHWGKAKIIQLLLVRDDVDVNITNKDGQTPLSRASEEGNSEVVRALLTRHDVDINSRDKYGWTPLSLAARNGNADVVKLLLAKNGVEADIRDKHGLTPLSHAAIGGGVEVAQLLIARHDVDINSADEFSCTPLSLAAHWGNAETVQLLLTRHDTDVNTKDDEGQTPLLLALAARWTRIIRLLLEREDVILHPSDIYTCMPLAFSFQGPYRGDLAQLLLVRAPTLFELDWEDEGGFTPLWSAAWHGDAKTVESLLTFDGVSVNVIAMDRGIPPLWAAAHHILDDNWTVIASQSSSVIDDNAFRQSKFSDNNQPSGFEPGTEATIRLLLARADVDVNWRNQQEETLLLKAAKNGYASLVEQLLSRSDIDVNMQDENGDSPLHCAVRYGHEEVASLLATRGDIALNLKNNIGWTPLHCAVVLHWQDNYEQMLPCSISPKTQEVILKIILAQDNIDLGLEDDNGLTALVHSRTTGATNIVNLLEEHILTVKSDHIVWQSVPAAVEDCRNMQHDNSSSDDSWESYYGLDDRNEMQALGTLK